jgi:ubiquinone/menaquinone biosynthesis C-methylase UbiE
MTANHSTPHLAAQEFFDTIADDYTARSTSAVYNLSSLSFSRRQDIVTRLMLTTGRGGTVLDYGMGPAVFGPAAAQHGLRYVGIDISPKMVELARQMMPTAELHVGDLSLLARFTRSADTVLLIGLIDYLQEPEEGLRQLARCVKPGGRLIMSFRNHNSVPRILRNSAKAIWRRRHTPQRAIRTAFEAPVLENSFVPRRDLIPLLQSEGFRSHAVHYLDCSPVFFNLPLPQAIWRLWKRADATLASRALSFMCASGVLIAYDKR